MEAVYLRFANIWVLCACGGLCDQGVGFSTECNECALLDLHSSAICGSGMKMKSSGFEC